MNNNIPKGWMLVTLGDISLAPQYGWTTRASTKGEIKYLRTTDISAGEINWEKVPYCEEAPLYLEKFKLALHDILISRAGSVGVSILIDTLPSCDVVFASYLIRIRTLAINPRFVFYYLKTRNYWDYISTMSAGIAVQNVNATKLSDLPILIAPPQQQDQIVGILDKFFLYFQQIADKIEKIEKILQKLHDQVIAEAVSGTLTSKWRKTNLSTEEYSADVSFSELEAEGLPKVPTNWKWHYLKDVSKIKGGVTKGRNLKGAPTVDLPYLRVANVQDGYLDLSEVKMIKIKETEIDTYQLKKGDILLTEGGDRDKLGRGTVWNEEIPCCIYQNHIFRARVIDPKLSPDFISLYTKSQFSKAYFFNNASQTVNLASINTTVLGNLPIPLPPYSEQLEIIKLVTHQRIILNSIKGKNKSVKTFLEQLKSTVLEKAFSNELVDSVLNDEMIGEVLSRIQDIREKTTFEAGPINSHKIKRQMMKTYNSLKEVLEDNQGKLTPKELWEKSSFKGNIDSFYAALKYEVEVLKQIEESKEKDFITVVPDEN